MTESKAPKWQRLADDLRERIRKGAYARGSALPQIREVAEETGLAYETVRGAFRALEDEGLVHSRKGQGTFVSPILTKIYRSSTSRYARSARETGQSRGAFDTEIRRLGMVPQTSVTISRERPPARVASLLEVSSRAKSVLVRDRTMSADGTVVQLAASYFPGSIAFGTQIEQLDTGPGGSLSRLAELGHKQVEITEDIDVRKPTKNEASRLSIPVDRPVYEITHVGRTAAGQAVEVAIHIAPTTLWTLSYTWPID